MAKTSYSVNTREAYVHLRTILAANLVAFLQSSPGMGKSSLAKKLCKEYNLVPIDLRLTGADRTDFNGLPDISGDIAIYKQFEDSFPTVDSVQKEGTNGWLVILDEFPSAPRDVMAASYKLILDRMIGNKKLHENVFILLAGNLASDKAIVNPIGSALQSRVIHIFLKSDYSVWLEDVAYVTQYDPRIIAFINMYPDKLNNFNPEHKEATFACERTWEFVNDLLFALRDDNNKITPVTTAHTPLFAGAIGEGIALEFVQFCGIFEQRIDIKQILQNPANAPIPSTVALKWSTITSLVSHAIDENLDALTTYANRFDMALRMVFYRSLLISKPSVRNHPKFQEAMVQLAQVKNSV